MKFPDLTVVQAQVGSGYLQDVIHASCLLKRGQRHAACTVAVMAAVAQKLLSNNSSTEAEACIQLSSLPWGSCQVLMLIGLQGSSIMTHSDTCKVLVRWFIVLIIDPLQQQRRESAFGRHGQLFCTAKLSKVDTALGYPDLVRH